MTETAQEERRSPRVLLRVALKVTFEGNTRDAETAVVNRQGALLLARQPYAEQVGLEITNLESQRKAPFRVVWSGGPGPRNLFKIGVELVDPLDDFWGPDYDRLAENASLPPS
jgi:hypothetical protein